MSKQRIEPRFGDAPSPSDQPERFVVEPRRIPASAPLTAREESATDSLQTIRRISWVVAVLCVVFLANELIKVYADQRPAGSIASVFGQIQERIRSASQGDSGEGKPAESADARLLSKTCEDWRHAFVADPSPATREEMLRHCQAYERYLASASAPAARPGP